jgi:GntR family carbon starvation induced transcriptional regulator
MPDRGGTFDEVDSANEFSKIQHIFENIPKRYNLAASPKKRRAVPARHTLQQRWTINYDGVHGMTRTAQAAARGPGETSQLQELDSDKGTLAARVYEQIRDEITRGILEPGQKLTLDFLRERYSLGMTPLREALYRLSVSMLVTVEDRRGFRVAAISPENLEEVITLRSEIEILLLRSSFQHADLTWEGRIVAAFHHLQRTAEFKPRQAPYTAEWEAAHREFHTALLSAARLPMLQEFHRSLWDHAARYRNLAHAIGHGKDVFEGHKQLMEAAIARDAEAACALLNRHISLATGDIMEKLFPAKTTSK